jgi:acetate---CoA ligase (ADP-forming)
MPEVGAIGFFSHSGALCAVILDWSRDHRVGFSLFASLGNQADLNETEVLQALTADDETRVIAAYLEGVVDGRAFFEALREACSRKPCVVLKSGRSAEGRRAAASHTAALAGSDRAFDAAVRQAGALRAETVEDLFDLARALVSQPLPSARRVTVVTNGGGLGVLAADAARAAALDLPPPTTDVRERLAHVLPAHAALGNPIDLIGDAGGPRYEAALHALGGDATASLVILAPQAATDAVGIANSIVKATREWAQPVLAVLAGGPRIRPGIEVLESAGIPCYPFPERAIRALAGMATLAERRSRPPCGAVPMIDPAPALAHADQLFRADKRLLGFVDAKPWLDAYGIRTARTLAARTPHEAGRLAREIGFPVALKIASPDLTHKTDVGGVRLGLGTMDEVSAAAAVMLYTVRSAHPETRIDGVLVQEMAPADASEMLLGMVRDPQFGPLVMVGFGGVYVEILGDTSTRLAPFDAAEAAAMVDELRMAPVLRGARGRPAVDLAGLVSTIACFAQLVSDIQSVSELEINPLFVGPAGSLAVDVRGVLGLESPST